jgi:nucleoside-diphosphate-sugar epimerase
MRVLVIGGTRFIGRAAVQRLAEAGHEVLAFHRGLSPFEPPSGIREIHGDRRNLSDSLDEFRSFGPEVVLHMIAFTEEDGQEMIRAMKGVARRGVAVSSVDVYRAYDRFRGVDPGPPDPTPLTEDSPLRDRLHPYRDQASGPEDFSYHYEKILMERAAQGDPEFPVTVLRLPMVYGPGDFQHRLFSYLKRMDDGRPAILLSEGEAAWRACRGYVEDMGEAIARCVTSGRGAGRTYHVAETPGLSEADWVRAIGKAAGWNGEVVVLPEEKLPASLRNECFYAQHWDLDASRIREELDYSEVVTPEIALARTVEWERANPPREWDPTQFDYAAEDAVLQSLR